MATIRVTKRAPSKADLEWLGGDAAWWHKLLFYMYFAIGGMVALGVPAGMLGLIVGRPNWVAFGGAMIGGGAGLWVAAKQRREARGVTLVEDIVIDCDAVLVSRDDDGDCIALCVELDSETLLILAGDWMWDEWRWKAWGAVVDGPGAQPLMLRGCNWAMTVEPESGAVIRMGYSGQEVRVLEAKRFEKLVRATDVGDREYNLIECPKWWNTV